MKNRKKKKKKKGTQNKKRRKYAIGLGDGNLNEKKKEANIYTTMSTTVDHSIALAIIHFCKVNVSGFFVVACTQY